MFSRRIDASRFGLIYAGAQKNMGPAGTTLVVIREDMMGKVERSIPSMLNYKIHAEAGSMYNTPPVYSIYVSMLTLRWIKRSEEHTSELQSLIRISYAVFCLKKKTTN